MNEPGRRKRGRDWRTSAILLAIWTIAMLFVAGRNDQIPLSMYGIATVFFVILIPAMNELVRTMERYAYGRNMDEEDEDDEGATGT